MKVHRCQNHDAFECGRVVREAGILLLLHRYQRVGIWAFDADKNRDKIRIAHHLQQLVVVGEIDRGFGRELERIAVIPLPNGQYGKELLDRLLVANEIVVDKIEVAAIAEIVQRFDLPQDLRIGLCAMPSETPISLGSR